MRVPVPSDSIELFTELNVSFSGFSSRSGSLTFGQQQIWRPLSRQKKGEQQGGSPLLVALPSNCSAGTLTAAVKELLRSHESLRTLVKRRDDGTYYQEVVGDGMLSIQVDTDAQAGNVGGTGFDHENELPIRMVVVGGKRGNRLVAEVSHFCSDANGILVLENHLKLLLSSPGIDSGRPFVSESVDLTCRQPLDQAQVEESAEGKAQADRALEFWRNELRCFPVFDMPRRPPEVPRFWRGTLTSNYISEAITRITDESGLNAHTVAMTAVAVTYGKVHNLDVVPLNVNYSNRHIPELRQSVVNLPQTVPITIDLRVGSFLNIARKAREAALRAYRHGMYPPAGLDKVLREVEAERGGLPDRYKGFNAVIADGSPEPVGYSSAERCFRWVHKADNDMERLWYFDYFGPDTVSLYADTCYTPVGEIQPFLESVEETLLLHADNLVTEK